MILKITNHNPCPNPIVAVSTLTNGATVRFYRNGMVDAIDGPTFSLSPGFRNLPELLQFVDEERATEAAWRIGRTNSILRGGSGEVRSR